MTGRETEFLPGLSLFFTHKGRKKLFELLGVSTQKEFMHLLNELETGKGIPDEMYEKILYAGLVWLNKEDITLDSMSDLIEKFYKTGKSVTDLENVIIDSYVNSGIYNREVIESARARKEDEIKNILAIIKSGNIPIPAVPKVDGQGNQVQKTNAMDSISGSKTSSSKLLSTKL